MPERGNMAEEFNVDGMLDMFLYESGQLLEKLEGIILEKQDAGKQLKFLGCC